MAKMEQNFEPLVINYTIQVNNLAERYIEILKKCHQCKTRRKETIKNFTLT
jgi:translation initiation factor 2 beta subunit (eIF-2beta)/eIF-5